MWPWSLIDQGETSIRIPSLHLIVEKSDKVVTPRTRKVLSANKVLAIAPPCAPRSQAAVKHVNSIFQQASSCLKIAGYRATRTHIPGAEKMHDPMRTSICGKSQGSPSSITVQIAKLESRKLLATLRGKTAYLLNRKSSQHALSSPWSSALSTIQRATVLRKHDRASGSSTDTVGK